MENKDMIIKCGMCGNILKIKDSTAQCQCGNVVHIIQFPEIVKEKTIYIEKPVEKEKIVYIEKPSIWNKIKKKLTGGE